jgi:carboxyl-terminal processing protease
MEYRFSRPIRTFLTALVLGGVFFGGLVVGFGKGADARNGGRLNTRVEGNGGVGRVLGVGQKPPKGIAADVDFGHFWEVWQDLSSHYYKQPVNDQALFYGALRGMAEAVDDPYTNFFEPVDAQTFANDLKGEFSGIGAEIGTKNGQLQIVAPLPDSPAEKAGIRAGDVILSIDGEESVAMSVDVAVSKIRGPKGTTVTLELGRMPASGATSTPEIMSRTITRAVITVKSVKSEYHDGGVAQITIQHFGDDTEALFRDAVDEALQRNVRGVIIDARNNPGGYLDSAIALAGEWRKDEVVVQQRERGVITQQYKGTGRGKFTGMKTVMLVNGGSASASEILAGALQDAGVATVVGERTFGKGSVQDYLEYEDGSALKVTIAEWLTPNGRSIDHEGIQPDVDISLTDDDIHAERDPQLDKALELIRTGQARP